MLIKQLNQISIASSFNSLELYIFLIQEVSVKEPSEEKIQTRDQTKGLYQHICRSRYASGYTVWLLINIPGQTKRRQNDDHKDEQ